jgi:hypothetical protein
LKKELCGFARKRLQQVRKRGHVGGGFYGSDGGEKIVVGRFVRDVHGGRRAPRFEFGGDGPTKFCFRKSEMMVRNSVNPNLISDPEESIFIKSL